MNRLQSISTNRMVAALVVAIMIVAGLTGYLAYNAREKPLKAVVSQKAATTETRATTPATPAELKTADNTLVQTNQDLEASLDTSALDEDINALL